MTTILHGTQAETDALVAAMKAYCDCSKSDESPARTCPGHEALSKDQRFVDGLLFQRRWQNRNGAELGMRVVPLIGDAEVSAKPTPAEPTPAESSPESMPPESTPPESTPPESTPPESIPPPSESGTT